VYENEEEVVEHNRWIGMILNNDNMEIQMTNEWMSHHTSVSVGE
jgi:hypothetical protein